MHSSDLKVGDRVKFKFDGYNSPNFVGTIISKTKTPPLSKYSKKNFYNYFIQLTPEEVTQALEFVNRRQYLKPCLNGTVVGYNSKPVGANGRADFTSCHITSKLIICKVDDQGNAVHTKRQQTLKKKAVTKALTEQSKREQIDKFFNKFAEMGMAPHIYNKYNPKKTQVTFTNLDDIKELLEYAHDPIMKKVFGDDAT